MLCLCARFGGNRLLLKVVKTAPSVGAATQWPLFGAIQCRETITEYEGDIFPPLWMFYALFNLCIFCVQFVSPMVPLSLCFRLLPASWRDDFFLNDRTVLFFFSLVFACGLSCV